MNVDDHVQKKAGFKFRGTILTIYPCQGEQYAVVLLDPNEAADGLQHIYKLSQLELL